MKRSEMLSEVSISNLIDLSREIAFHEAGHATAIYLGNKQKGLPSTHFDIYKDSSMGSYKSYEFRKNIDNQFYARLDGGRLLQNLPTSFAYVTKLMSADQVGYYESEIKADIMNLLAGPLAEAKYIALRDGELINHRLVDFNSLQFYGGISDCVAINEYLDFWIGDLVIRAKTIKKLTRIAYDFIDNGLHWYCISKLAEYILNANRAKIEYQEISEVIDKSRHQYCLNQHLIKIFPLKLVNKDVC